MNDFSDMPTASSRDQPGEGVALVIIDMINRFDFPGAEAILPGALRAARTIHTLRCEIERRGWPVIYVNDNFGEWHSERSRLVKRALQHPNPITELLQPRDDDFFVIKPQFSGFYSTNLPVLLPKLGVTRLILTGIATDICVLFTAADAHMRDYAIWVPADTVAAEQDDRSGWALDIMASSMAAQTSPTTDYSVDDWIAHLELSGRRNDSNVT